MQLIYFMSESLAPEKFARILNPADARYELERYYLFGGSSMSSISSRHTITRNTQSGIGVSSYREDSGMKRGVFDELKRGSLLAVDASIGAWSPVKYPFFINAQGRLQRYPGTVLPPQYPVERIIQRYEEMISRYAARPKPTSLPPRQNTAKNPPMMQAVAAAVGSSLTVIKEVVRPMSKQERWQARKYLIGRGERSIYPDARIAAQRLAQNNVAVEKAKLAQNVYNTTNPLAATPGVPEGWRDVSNDGGFLDGLGIRREMLYDNEISPGFLARVYAPDKAVFGDDMNPTVVFRGSRMPELPNGKLNAAKKIFIDRELPEIKNLEDWTNNFNQGRGAESAYYQRAVDIGSLLKGRVDTTGHSLGGGLASAASMTSGKSGWTFNAAGLNSSTVEKYGGSLVGREDIINAYRVKGEVLTRLQEVDLRQDFIDVNGNLALLAAKEKLSSHLPDAVGVKHTLDGGVGNMGDRHGIQQVIDCIEQEKDDDIAKSVTGYRNSMRQVFNVFAALFIAIGLMLTTGCKEKGMDLPPEGYFTGQQLALAKAISDGNIGDIKRLAKETDLNSPGEHDMTLLFYALATSTHDNATPERLQIATELVKAGADPLQPRPNGGASPAEWMAKLDNGIWLKALLDGGLSPNARGKLDGLPIIFQTIKSSNTETMATLIKYGADINIQDRLKRTPLVECAYLGRIDHMNLLLKHGANPFIEDRFGENFVDLLDDKIKKTEGNDSLHTRYLELKKQLRVQ